MANKQILKPTDAELAILNVLWRLKAGTVREIDNELITEKDVETGYNTTLKLLQIMAEKRLVDRDDSQRPQIFRPKDKEINLGDIVPAK